VDHAFGSSAPFRLGVEEELLLVDADTLGLAHVASSLLPAVRPARGEVKFDVYEALAETASGVCDDAARAVEDLAVVRGALRAAGATLIGGGIHPDGAMGDVVHVPGERYAQIADSMRGLLRRTPTCALHVHVGMPGGDACVRAANALRGWLPVLQALAAHSPWWHGLDSGFATARAQLFRGYPRGYIPPAWDSWDHYAQWTAQVVAAAGVPDYTYLWWDLRPHPNLGTLEVRAMDAQSALWSVRALAGLVHGLALHGAEHGPQRPPQPGEALMESSFRAGRDGLAALVWDGERMRPVRELAAEAIALAGDHGAEAARILRAGNGADRMRAAHERGGMRGMLEHLRDEALEPGQR
jgi:carboxylate-amine ligase